MITITYDDTIATICLNRPDQMNALSTSLLENLSASISELEENAGVRTIVITGAGEKAYCAGADLKERATMTISQVKNYLSLIRGTFLKIENCPKPTIALINGLALGGGCELALSCDIRYMLDTATIGLTETRLAIIPGAGGTQRLSRLIGKARAKELIFTGRKLSAQSAYTLGICEFVGSKEEVDRTIKSFSEELKLTGPLAISQAKFAIDKGFETDLRTGLDLEAKAYECLFNTQDRVEALLAFKEKRLPTFIGK